ncbi:uncharacterized protein LOC127879717 isoform X2 [Dreissena polymorpha]|uniref:uncharacterized protein LOC127879717 isoform X2 n=1 Tax=Dreissena polymorpha TaxID=45954 RepID=UPI002264BBF1|nr:uncharacterized protein LOC127879717 isoform X2 [Dreissena polymorpha]
MYSNEVWPSIKINRNCTINYASTERKGGKMYQQETTTVFLFGFFLNACKGAVHPDNNFNISVSMGLTEESLQEEQFTSKNMTFAEKTLNPPREIQFVRVTVYRVAGVDDDFMGLCEIMIYRQAAAVCEKSYYVLFAATLAVSLVLGVVLAAVIIFLVVYIRRRHHQSTGRISADTESSPQNDYEDLSTNRNHSNYDCLQMPTFEKPGRTENIARSKAASTNRLGQ